MPRIVESAVFGMTIDYTVDLGYWDLALQDLQDAIEERDSIRAGEWETSRFNRSWG